MNEVGSVDVISMLLAYVSLCKVWMMNTSKRMRWTTVFLSASALVPETFVNGFASVVTGAGR